MSNQHLTASQSKDTYCNFCHKTGSEVRFIIAGKTGNICNECIPQCIEVMNEYFQLMAADLDLAKDKIREYEGLRAAMKPANPEEFESHKGEN